MQRWGYALLGAVVLAAGCGGGAGHDSRGTQRTPTGAASGTEQARQPAPARVVSRCHELAASRALPVLCPRQLPTGRWVVNHRTLRVGACQYLMDLETRPFGVASPFHILAGGRCGAWPLTTTSNNRWPTRVPLQHDLGLVGARPLTPGQTPTDQRYLRLRLLRRARLADHPALVLATAPYPNGGVHGGHTVLVWNQGGDGYTLTMHFRPDDRRPAATRIALLLRAAAAMAD